MNIDYLIFINIVDNNGISAAARRLRISAAKASKHLARLETRLGVRLLNRSTRGIALTDAGQTFYEDIRRIMGEASAAEARVSQGSGILAGTLRIQVFSSFARISLARKLKTFVDLHPALNVYLHIEDGKVDFVRNRLDLAITVMPTPDPFHCCHILAANERILCASSAYLDEYGEPKDIAELEEHNIVAPDSPLAWELEGPEGRLTFFPKSRVQTNSSDIPRDLILSGLGIGLRSTWSIKDDLQSGALRRVLPRYHGPSSLRICVFHPRSAVVSPGAAAFIKFLEATYSEVIEGKVSLA